MCALVRHRVVSPILTTNRLGFVTVPAGSIIEIFDDIQQPGLHSAKLDGEELFVFARDIEERTEPMEQTTAVEEIAARKNS